MSVTWREVKQTLQSIGETSLTILPNKGISNQLTYSWWTLMRLPILV